MGEGNKIGIGRYIKVESSLGRSVDSGVYLEEGKRCKIFLYAGYYNECDREKVMNYWGMR